MSAQTSGTGALGAAGAAPRLGRLAGVRMVSADPERLAAFYVAAFGFARATPRAEEPEALGRLVGAARAETLRLVLGEQEIELVRVLPAGRAYPGGTGAADTIFQHIALVVPDMGTAMAALEAAGGHTPISRGGPQRLPERSGGVTAYKFRDPEGHPLEYLEFPAGAVPPAWADRRSSGPCLGFDHSAIVVTDTAASLAWYGRLGLVRGEASLNTGPEQARLDGVENPEVEVTALEGGASPPHVELLRYRGGTARGGAATRDADVAATQIAFAVDEAALDAFAAVRGDAPPGIVALGGGVRAALLRDPDGHRLLVRTPGANP